MCLGHCLFILIEVLFLVSFATFLLDRCLGSLFLFPFLWAIHALVSTRFSLYIGVINILIVQFLFHNQDFLLNLFLLLLFWKSWTLVPFMILFGRKPDLRKYWALISVMPRNSSHTLPLTWRKGLRSMLSRWFVISIARGTGLKTLVNYLLYLKPLTTHLLIARHLRVLIILWGSKISSVYTLIVWSRT